MSTRSGGLTGGLTGEDARGSALPNWVPTLIALASSVLIDVAGNLVVWMLTDGVPPPWLKITLRVVTYVLIALLLIAGLAFVRYLRRSGPVEPGPPPPPPPAPVRHPPAVPHRVRLFGRRWEVSAALARAKSAGLVAIVGARDIGTSAVAREVVERLSYDRVIHDQHTVSFDVRSRWHAEPADPRAVAGRVLFQFGLDEPADDTPEVLAEAGHRLLAALHERRVTLLLDNVSLPEQVSWLTNAWSPAAPPPLLVIAGEAPVAAAVRADDTIMVGELSLADMRDMLRAELGSSTRGARDLFRAVFGGPKDAVDELLASFQGRPRAVQDIARALRESGRHWDLAELARELEHGSGALDGLWAAILRRKQGALSERARWLMHVLAELPVTELDRDAIDAMLAAAPDHRSAAGHGAGHAGGAAGRHPVVELGESDIVRESPPGRYRLPTEVRQAVALADPGWSATPEMAEAVRRLVGYYAEQARGWAGELVTATARGPAMAWLHQQEGLLRGLLRDWPEATAPLDDLAAIADVLDIWYGREQQSVGLRQTSERLRTLALRADRADLAQLAMIRLAAAWRMVGRLDEAELALAEADRSAPAAGPTSAALQTRLHNERALVHHARATRLLDGTDGVAAADALDNADRELRQAWATVPRADIAGAVCVLINMAAVCLGQDRPLRAQTHLDQAETMARTGGDMSGEAQVIELQGVVAARRRRFEQAVRLWQRANGRYAQLGEEQGQARCLQHLGSAALVVPEVAGLLHVGRAVRLSAEECARVAWPLLQDSKRLRAGQPHTELVDRYLRLVAGRLPPEA